MNNTSTFYLKYRPQTISQLDLKEIRDNLGAVLSSGTMIHAFLFSGSKGLGKTSAARIVAKSINCEAKRKKGEFEPCNKCFMCQSITNGTSLDLIEIDAASNRGIDDIRELREKIKLTPYRARKKVYVIDEVHMLTQEAFNALLKTLEEPPAHALFILCTTEAYKLPETIISRCYEFNFKKASIKELVRCLKRIERGEKLKLAKGVKSKIASLADASFRDATKNLEILVSLNGKNISLKKTRQFFDQSQSSVDKLLVLLADRQSSQALKWLTETLGHGADIKQLTQSLLIKLRDIILLRYEVLDDKKDYHDFGLSVIELKKLVYLFDQALRQLKGAFLPQLPLELAIVEWCEQKKENNQNQEHKIKQTPAAKGKKVKIKVGHKQDLDIILEQWPKLLQQVKQFNHSIEALLKATKPVKFENNLLTIEVFYPFHKQKLEESKSLSIVQDSLQKILSLSVKIKYKLAKKGGEEHV